MKIFKSAFFALLILACGLATAWAYTSNDYYQAGKKLYGTGAYDKAQAYFSAAIKLDPNNIGALQARGNCYYAQGQYQNALADYQQVQSLHPSDQMAAFIEKVKVKAGSGATSTTSAPANGGAMAQGIAYYQQKQYGQAIDAFEQATQQDPQNYKPFYYLGMARLMNGDKRGAALSLAIANELHPSAGLAAYVDKLKASLSGDDRSWVQANLNSYDQNNGHHKNGAPEKMIGIRIEPALAMPALSDLNTDAKTQIAVGQADQSFDPSLKINATVPAGYMDVTLEPTLKVLPFLELGLPIMIMPIGNYTATATDSNGLNNTSTYSISGFGVGLNARMFLGSGSLKPFVALGPIVAPISLNYTGPVNGASTITGSTSSLALGGQLQVGADLSLSDDLFLSVFAGYRVLSASGFTGTFTGSGSSETGEFYMLQGTYGYSIWAANQTYINSLPAGTSYRPLSIDLGGPILGIQGALYF